MQHPAYKGTYKTCVSCKETFLTDHNGFQVRCASCRLDHAATTAWKKLQKKGLVIPDPQSPRWRGRP
jgi:hypothetical protein